MKQCLKSGIVILLVLLTGCTWLQQTGGVVPDLSPTPSATPSPTYVPEVTPTRAFQPAPQYLTLKMWVPEFLDPYSETAGGKALLTQLQAFSVQNDTVQVEVIAKRDAGPGGLLNLLSTAIDVAPSILPDVIVLNEADMKNAANAGIIRPLEDVSVSWSDFYPFAVSGLDIEQAVYGLPFVADAEQMVYRQGIADTAPISWTAVITNAYTMLFPAGSPDKLANDALLSAYIGSGGRVVEQDGQATLDRLYLEKLYAFFLDMLRYGLIDADQALSLPDTAAAWAVYQQGVGHMAPVSIGQYWQDPPQGSRPAWVPNALGKPTVIVRDWSLAIVTSDPDREQAANKLIGWLVDPGHMSEFSRSARLVPTRRHAVRLWGLFPEDREFLETLLDSGVPALSPDINISVRSALQFGLIAVLTEEVDTPEEAAVFALTDLRR
ncbi:MAG: extracellular solute-binding protein [Anaerolineae bacterium]|nr:extracellular solute-binding protein [Anaerolineae bacterium]